MLGNNNALMLATYNAEASMQHMKDLKDFIHIKRDKCFISPSSTDGIYTQMDMYTYSMCKCQSYFSKAQPFHQQERVLLQQRSGFLILKMPMLNITNIQAESNVLGHGSQHIFKIMISLN
jgi:hypothetical protein